MREIRLYGSMRGGEGDGHWPLGLSIHPLPPTLLKAIIIGGVLQICRAYGAGRKFIESLYAKYAKVLPVIM